MDKREVFWLSAEGCGHKPVQSTDGFGSIRLSCYNGNRVYEWSPFTNAEQRWECVRKLLVGGDVWFYGESCHTRTKRMAHVRFDDSAKELAPIDIDCPAEEFPARALAELRKRREGCSALKT